MQISFLIKQEKFSYVHFQWDMIYLLNNNIKQVFELKKKYLTQVKCLVLTFLLAKSHYLDSVQDDS